MADKALTKDNPGDVMGELEKLGMPTPYREVKELLEAVRVLREALANYRTHLIATGRPDYIDDLLKPINDALSATEKYEVGK